MNETDLSPLFPTLEPKLLSELVKVGEIRKLPAGQEMLKPGQSIRATMLVISGLIKICRHDDNGNEYFMYYLAPGEACAVSIISAQKLEASGVNATAISDSVVICVPLRHVDEWIGKYKSWSEYAITSYRDRFQDLLQALDEIAFKNMDERLLNYLKRHKDKMKTNVVKMTFTDIARELHTSREVVSRLMRKLADKKLIALHKSHVEILALDE